MKVKLVFVVSMFAILSMLFSACAPAASPAPAAPAKPADTAAPAKAADTAVPAAPAKPADTAAPAAPAATEPKYGGTLRAVLFATIDKLDPAVAISFQEWFIVTNQTHNGLMMYDFDDKLKPDLAESYEMNKEGNEFTFKLAQGRKFSNGREFEAADVKYSFSRVANPKTGSWGQQMIANIVGAKDVMDGKATEISGIEVIDKYTVKIKLVEPQSTFISFLAASPIFINPKEEVDKWGAEYPMHAVGTGPFMIDEWTPGVKLVLKQNPYYYELPKRPYLDKIEYTMGVDEQTTLLKIQAGDADITADLMPPSVVQQVTADPSWKPYIYSRDGFSPAFMWMNSMQKPFDDVRVRQAVLYAVDMDRIGKMIQGVGKPIYGLYVPGATGYDPKFRPYPYNPEKAKQLLAEAGYPNGLKVKFYWHDEVASWTIFPPLIQQDLAKVGIDAELVRVTVPAKNEMARAKSMQMFTGGWGPATVDSADWFNSIFLCARQKEETGYPSYCNPKIDEMFAQTQKSFDETERAKIFRQLEDILMAVAPMLPLMNMSYFVLVNPRVKGYSAHILTPPINPWVWLDDTK